MLLGQDDIDPDKPDNRSQTPISWAARRGHERIMVRPLERNDLNPDTADGYGCTPLSWTATLGYQEILRILLERGDVNPHTADENGRTLISWAVEGGCLELEMLLQRNILTRLEEYRAEHFSPGLPGVGLGGL